MDAKTSIEKLISRDVDYEYSITAPFWDNIIKVTLKKYQIILKKSESRSVVITCFPMMGSIQIDNSQSDLR